MIQGRVDRKEGGGATGDREKGWQGLGVGRSVGRRGGWTGKRGCGGAYGNGQGGQLEVGDGDVHRGGEKNGKIRGGGGGFYRWI